MKNIFNKVNPLVLIIVDGWGVAPPSAANIFSQAVTPVIDNLITSYPVFTLDASGQAVGLRPDQPGSSGAGHLTIGVGRTVPYQKQDKYTLTNIPSSLSQLISQAGLHQIHLAETEKYNQVTFYFNGKNGQPFKNEEWVLIPSPQASDYADYPEMSAFEITSRAAREIRKKKYQFILINYCNPDIIGWSNNQAALKKSIEIVDQCLGQIIPEALDHDGTVLITADHGQPGTINPVPLILIGKDWEGKSAPGGDTIGKDLSLIKPAGGLADVAPTILKLLGIKKPAEMTGQPLI